jgi:hypothetical protein
LAITWRNRLLTRCRTTAPPTERETTMPIRGWSPVPRARQWTTRWSPRTRRPRPTVRRKSALRRSRWRAGSTIDSRRRVVRRTAQSDPCACGPRGSRGRLASACVGGSRASSRDAGCSAGRFACSRRTPDSFVGAGPSVSLHEGRRSPQPNGGIDNLRNPVTPAAIGRRRTARRHATAAAVKRTNGTAGEREGSNHAGAGSGVPRSRPTGYGPLLLG